MPAEGVSRRLALHTWLATAVVALAGVLFVSVILNVVYYTTRPHTFYSPLDDFQDL